MNSASAQPSPRPLATFFLNGASLWILIGLNLLLFVAFYGRFGDLIVDCSREATVPWRILHGDLIYRDFNYEYGPLAPYFLALCYRLFGVHLLTLNLAGLAISSAVTLLIYALSRMFLGRLLSLGVGALFVFVFAFQYSSLYNIFTYVFPYTYAASLGVLLLLSVFYAGYRALETEKTVWFSRLGLLLALASLTKVEFIVAAVLFVLLLLPLLVLKTRRQGAFSRRRLGKWLWALAWPAGGVLIPVCGYFASRVDLLEYYRNELARMTSLNLPAARAKMGAEHLQASLIIVGGVVLAYAALAVVFFGVDRLAQRVERRTTARALRMLCTAGLGLSVAAVAAWTAHALRPINVFAGMAAWIPLIGACAAWAIWISERDERTSNAAIFVACTAVVSFVLLIRILLNARPLGYGVFLMVPGTLLLLYSVFAFLPAMLRRRGSRGRFHVWGFAVFFAVAGTMNFAFSLHQYRAKNVAVATARGTMRLPRDQASALTQLLEFFRDKRDYSLLVLPEGNMINFLLDSIPKTYSYAYVPGLLKTPAQEDRIIREIREIPIDYVLVVTRWTTEFGFPVVGVDYAWRLKQVIDANYQSVAQFGPPPFSRKGFGMLLMERKDRLGAAEPVPGIGTAP